MNKLDTGRLQRWLLGVAVGGMCLGLSLVPSLAHGQKSLEDSIAFVDYLDELVEISYTYATTGVGDSALWYAHLLEEKSREHGHWEHNLIAYLCMTLVDEARIDYESLLRHAQEGMAIADQHLPIDNGYRQSMATKLGDAYTQWGDYEAAENLLEAAAKHPDMNGLPQAKIYALLGINSLREGDYQQTISMYEQERMIAQEMLETGEEASREECLSILAANTVRQAKIMVELQQSEAASSLFLQGLSLYGNLPEEAFWKRKIGIWHSLGFHYAEQLEADSLKICIAHSSSLQKQYGPYAAQVTEELQGHHAALLRQWEEAEAHFLAAQRMRRAQRKTARVLANGALPLIRAYQAQTAYPQALRAGRQALADMSAGNIDTVLHALPAIEDIIYPLEGLELLSLQGAAWLHWYLEDSLDTDKLTHAVASFQSAIEVVRLFRDGFWTEDARLYWSNKLLPLYEQGIQSAYLLHQKTQDKHWLEVAFSFAEMGNSLSLYESLKANEARLSPLLPDSVQQQEKQSRRKVAFYRKQWFAAISSGQATAKVEALNAKLFDNIQARKQFIDELEGKYPAYVEAKYRHKMVGLTEAQALLPDDKTVLLEFVEGEQTLFLFVMSREEQHLLQLPWGSQQQAQLWAFHELLTNRELVMQGGNSPETIQRYGELAHQLYENLLGKAQASLGISPKHWIIIPSGSLHYIPFEALMTEAVNPDDGLSWRNLPYLLKSSFCTYQPSASLYRDDLHKLANKSSVRSFAGFAPTYLPQQSFSAVPSGFSPQPLAPLPYCEEEIRTVNQLMEGDQFLGERASRAQFLEVASRYDILHLSMHGLVNETFPEFSSLLFSTPGEQAEAGALYASEIRQMDLNAQLTVLSACNTGSGALVPGEGVLSLARAFQLAGCPSILMSLWQADDFSTSVLMKGFYEQLLGGSSKGEAIRQSKLEYLHTQLDNHPYFWSTFVLIGPDQALYRSPVGSWIWWVGSGLVLVVLVWMKRKRSLRKQLS